MLDIFNENMKEQGRKGDKAIDRRGNKIAVIGGGASGLMAAITAAARGGDVEIFEKNDRVGKKILATGNGKCNLSNLNMDLSCFHSRHKELLSRYFNQFSVHDTVAFFEGAGMMIKEKNEYLYPLSEQASTVLDILRMEGERYGIRINCQTVVEEIGTGRNCFYIDTGGKRHRFDKVILACGSKASMKSSKDEQGYGLVRRLGHYTIPIVPALVQLLCQENYLKALAGVRCQAKVMLFVNGTQAAVEEGEVQFVSYGISGIPVFQLSREASYALLQKKEVTVSVDFFPGYEERSFARLLKDRYMHQSHKTLEDFLIGMTNKKINQVMIKSAGYKGTIRVRDLGYEKIVEFMRGYRAFGLRVTRANDFEKAQVCAGGVPLKEMSEHLESLKVPGLYITGELLDVDGRCGGYNLQWAWTSGFIAGVHAAGSVQKK